MRLNRLLQVGILVCFCAVAVAGGTQADYDRAEKLSDLFSNKVYRTDIEPHWFDDNTKFWYTVQTGPISHTCIVVDVEERCAKTGVRFCPAGGSADAGRC